MQRPYKSSAWAYLIGDIAYVGPHTTYRDVVGSFECGPVRSSRIDDTVEVNVIIRSALDNLEAANLHSNDHSDLLQKQPVLDAAGLKSFKALMAVAKHVGIVQWNDSRVEFSPSRNEGTRRGYLKILPREEAANKDDYASALKRAFDRCE